VDHNGSVPRRVEVGLLGPVTVQVDGQVVPVGSGPQRALLARMVLSPGCVASVHSLVDTVWGEDPPTDPVARLQVYVSRLRRAVGRERIRLEPGGYRIAVDRVDIGLAERLVAQARDAAPTNLVRAAGLLGDALALWRGEPLSDLRDPLAFAPELARLAEWRRQLREEWFELRLAAGEAGPALPDLESAVAADPLRERLSLVLARALHQLGRTAEALRALDGFRRRMAEDSGLEPSPALADLRRRLLADDAAPRRPAPEAHVRPGTPPPPPPRQPAERFVGRRVELGRLLHLVAEADAGRGGVALVAGEPGIGKTRLLATFGEVATDRGALVLAGRCLEGAGGSPYHPFAEAIDGFLATEPAARPAGLDAIAPVIPRLGAGAVDPPTAPALQPDELRLRLLDGVLRFLLALTERRTAIVVVDDLHWAESSTIAMLRHVARGTRGHRLLLVGAYRGGELAEEHPLSDALAELRSETECTAVALAGLERYSVDRLLVGMAGRPLAAALVDAIAAQTGGNPFFAREMLRHLLEDNALTPDVDGLLHAALPLTAVPEGVRQVIARRRRRLSAAANKLLEAAAAIDGPFPFEPVADVSGLAAAIALTALDEALDAGLVVVTPAPERYDFAHALVRNAVYSAMNPSRRIRTHRRMAEMLAAARAAGLSVRSSEIAIQYHRSAVLPGAHLGVEPALDAAALACAAGAHDEDAAWLEIARRLARPEDPRLPEVLRRWAIALAWSLRFDRAVDVAREALAATAERAGPAATAKLAAGLATTLVAAGSSTHAWELTPIGLGIATDGAEPARADPVSWAELTLLDLERREAADPANPGILLDVPERRTALRILADAGLVAGRADLGRYAVAALHGSRERVPPSAAEDPTVAMLLMGDFTAALPRFEAAAATAGARGQLAWELYCRSGVARCQASLGELDAAAGALEVANDLAARMSGDRTSWPRTAHLGATDALAMALDRGWEQVLAASQPLLRPGLPEHQWAIATLEAAHARARARLGDAEGALPLLRRPVRALRHAPTWAPNYLRTACDVAETLWLLDAREHLDDVETALRRAERSGFRFPMMDARLALARVCALGRRGEEAGRWFAAARVVLDEQAARPLRAVVDHDEALMHLRHGDPATARPLAAAAADQFRDLGVTGWQRRLFATAP
jgi:DNA-binding SARP family transcriptional activator